MSFERQREEILKYCRDLFNENRVDLILGFTSGEAGRDAVPCFIRSADELDGLRWDEMCRPNLAKYLTEKKGRVGIIAKPCDARAIAMYLAENQIDRNNVYIIGVECAGMKSGDQKPEDGNKDPWCENCTVRIPPVYDVLVRYGDIPVEPGNNRNTEAEGKDFEDRLSRFQSEIKKCILCFSCRQACYGCYCETCFIDRNIPNWLPAELDMGRKMVFHLGRAMHLAGRCVECGACERTCPSGVKIRYLTDELNKLCEELYGYRAGVNPEEVPAMTAFSQNDREVGFLGGEDSEACNHSKKQD